MYVADSLGVLWVCLQAQLDSIQRLVALQLQRCRPGKHTDAKELFTFRKAAMTFLNSRWSLPGETRHSGSCWALVDVLKLQARIWLRTAPSARCWICSLTATTKKSARKPLRSSAMRL